MCRNWLSQEWYANLPTLLAIFYTKSGFSYFLPRIDSYFLELFAEGIKSARARRSGKGWNFLADVAFANINMVVCELYCQSHGSPVVLRGGQGASHATHMLPPCWVIVQSIDWGCWGDNVVVVDFAFKVWCACRSWACSEINGCKSTARWCHPHRC